MEDWAPGQFAEWWEIDWDDMPYAAQRAFETLGWTSKSWDPDDPTPCPESDNIPWAELNSVQQEAAAILGFDEAELGRRMKNEMKLPSNFERLVLGCIDSYDSDQRLILQHFSRSTRFAFLCTAQISKFQEKFVKNFDGMKK